MKSERLGGRKKRDSHANSRIPDLGYYIIIIVMTGTEET